MFNIRITGQNGEGTDQLTSGIPDVFANINHMDHFLLHFHLVTLCLREKLQANSTPTLWNHPNTSEHGSNDFKTGIVPSNSAQ